MKTLGAFLFVLATAVAGLEQMLLDYRKKRAIGMSRKYAIDLAYFFAPPETRALLVLVALAATIFALFYGIRVMQS